MLEGHGGGCRFFIWAQPRARRKKMDEWRRRCFLPTGTLASTNPLCLEPVFYQGHSALLPSPPAHLPTFICPPSPASPLRSSTSLNVSAPQTQVRSVEETFSRILQKGKEGRGRKQGYDGEKSSQSLQLQIFFLIFLIMTHVYNTKYLDQKQSCCRDTKSTFIAGHKDE